jgi:hypothetical protein
VSDAARRGQLELDSIADESEANPVSILHCGGGEQSGGLGSAIGLGCALEAESHAGGDIDDEPKRERAFGGRRAGPGGP